MQRPHRENEGDCAANQRRGLGIRGGSTIVEVLVVIGILAVLIGILIPVITRARQASKRVTCISNLRELDSAFHIFANRNGGILPDPSATQVSWETSLSPFTHPGVFACPADGEIYPAVGSSYDWRDTPDPTTTLAGQHITSPARSSLIIVFEALPGWHARDRICAARLDGSAEDMDYISCMQDLETSNMEPRVRPQQ